MSSAPWERGKSFRVTVDPAEHTWPVKEELVLQRILGVYVYWCGERGWGRKGCIPRKVGNSWGSRYSREAKDRALLVDPESSLVTGTNLSTHHPPKWPWASVVSNPITKTSFPNALIARRVLVSHKCITNVI